MAGAKKNCNEIYFISSKLEGMSYEKNILTIKKFKSHKNISAGTAEIIHNNVVRLVTNNPFKVVMPALFCINCFVKWSAEFSI